MNKRTLTDRQMAIVELIAERKKEGADMISLDEIAKRVERCGLNTHRNSLIVSMNILIERLTAQGVFIEKVEQMGRGARQFYRIRRG
jgi:predicted transcriptional regulator